MTLNERLHKKLKERENNNALRELKNLEGLVDFCSNDYLGFSRESISVTAESGSTGSRLISGNKSTISQLELDLSERFGYQSSVLFGSGYQANQSIIEVMDHTDTVFVYDELVHASIRQGLFNAKGKTLKFKHNDIDHLEARIEENQERNVVVFIESIYSMDGDAPDLEAIRKLKQELDFTLVVDEAHALGVAGKDLNGMFGSDLADIKLVAFGKAMGAEGAMVLCNAVFKQSIVNFSPSFIYTTAPSPIKVGLIRHQFEKLNQIKGIDSLLELKEFIITGLSDEFDVISSEEGCILSVLIKGNDRVQTASDYLRINGIGVVAIKAPTVKAGAERLRVCVHSYNSKEEAELLISSLLEWKEKAIL